MQHPKGSLLAVGLATLVLAAAVVPLEAQARSALREGSSQAGSSSDEQARERVLYREAGAPLLARSRFNSAQRCWEVEERGSWVPLANGSVLRVRNAQEVREEARHLERQLTGADPARRVALAEWLLSNGLRVEALEALDQVLEVDPDQRQAQELLQRNPMALALPQQDEEADAKTQALFLAEVGRLTPCARELALQRLRNCSTDGLATELAEQLLGLEAGRRAFAARALGKLCPGGEPQALTATALLDRDAGVRHSAVQALCSADLPQAQSPALAPGLRALSSRSASVRMHAAELLGALRAPSSVEPLVALLAKGPPPASSASGLPIPGAYVFFGRQKAYVQDFDVEIATNSAIADPTINLLQEGVVLEARVLGVSSASWSTERAGLCQSLRQVTRLDPGPTPEDWVRWWNQEGHAWVAAESGKRPRAPLSGG